MFDLLINSAFVFSAFVLSSAKYQEEFDFDSLPQGTVILLSNQEKILDDLEVVGDQSDLLKETLAQMTKDVEVAP